MDELLMKYIKGETTPEERDQVIHWLDESPAHIHQYKTLRKLYTVSLWSVEDKGEDKVKNETEDGEPSKSRSYLFEFLKIAAVLLLGIFGTYMYQNIQESKVNMQTIFVPAGQRAELSLADGTKVWLNARTTLRFPDRFQDEARKVELDGEGYFEVARNEKAPFTVRTSSYDVKVLGTEFNVKAYSQQNDKFETALLKGSVEVADRFVGKSLRLKPNEVVYHKDGELKKKQIVNKNYFRWKEGLLCFDDETIGSLIEKLELYYDVKIEVQRPELIKHRYSGKFRINDGVEHALRVLQLRHKFKYSRNEENNIITIN